MTRIANFFCIIMALGACLVGGFSTAAGVDFTYQGSALWGYMYDAVTDGEHAFCAMSHGFMILDITDPAAPVAVSRYGIFGGFGECIAVSGNYAYMGVRDSDMVIFDVSDVTSPQLVGRFPLINWATSISIVGSTAFVSDAFQGLRIVDVSDPANPTQISFSPAILGNTNQISVIRGNILYISSSHYLQLVDISDLANPQQIGSYLAPNHIWDIALADSLAYIACGSSGMIVLNVADPAAPVETSRLAADSVDVRSLVLEGNTVYWGQGNYQYGYKLIVVDVSDPLSPTITDQMPSGGYLFHAASGRMFGTDINDSYELYDVADPSQPQVLSANSIPYYGYPGYGTEIAGSGNYVYIAGGNMGLIIVDNTNPTQPTVVSQGINSGVCCDLAMRDQYVYLAHYGIHGAVGLKVVDVSNPTEPAIVGICQLPSCIKIAVAGNYAFLGGNGPTNYIVDISDPTNPVEVGTTDISGMVNGLAAAGNYLYISYGFGIVVVDISDPSQPSIVDTLASENGYGELSIYKGYLLAAVTNAFQVMDIATDPASPTLVGSCACGASDFKPYGDYLFVGNRQGVSIVDMTDPLNPSIIGSRPIHFGAGAVAPYHNGVVAYDPEGLTTFEVAMPACCTHPGDANNDLATNLADVVYIINYIFKGGPSLLCPAAGDANGDCDLNIGDAVYLVNYIFKSGDAPVCSDCP